MLSLFDFLGWLSFGLVLRGNLLLDYGRIAEEQGYSVRTVAAHLWNWCPGNLRYEADEETACLAVFDMRPGDRDCGVHHRLCRDIFLWSSPMGLSETVHVVCLVLLLVLIADCILSALFRTPITY